MKPDDLKQRVLEEFSSIGLLKSLDIESSAFKELPRLFEASHIGMRLVLANVAAVAAASSIAAKMKRDVEREGVELEYEIRPQWKVVGVGVDTQEACDQAGCLVSGRFQVEVQSGSTRRCMLVQVSAGARACILRYLEHVPAQARQSAISKVLETCVNQKLSSRAEEYWDPVLYPTRHVERRDVARIVESRVEWKEQELAACV